MKKNRQQETSNKPPKMPGWMLLLIIAGVLPVGGRPWYMAQFDFHKPEQTTFLAVVFPIYIVLCGYVAYKCYPFRKEITYILIAIMWLSYVAGFYL